VYVATFLSYLVMLFDSTWVCVVVKIYILVATEIGRGLAGAPPFARWWTKSFITKAI